MVWSSSSSTRAAIGFVVGRRWASRAALCGVLFKPWPACSTAAVRGAHLFSNCRVFASTNRTRVTERSKVSFEEKRATVGWLDTPRDGSTDREAYLIN